jgi:hypothetical protein
MDYIKERIKTVARVYAIKPESTFWVVLWDKRNGRCISTKSERHDQFDINALNENVMKALNSDEDYQVDRFSFKWIEPSPVGSGSSQPVKLTGAGSQSLLMAYPYKDDHTCAQRSIVLLCIRKDKDSNKQLWENVRTSREKNKSSKRAQKLIHLATELSELSGVDFKTPTTFGDLDKLAKGLSLQRGATCIIRVFESEKIWK